LTGSENGGKFLSTLAQQNVPEYKVSTSASARTLAFSPMGPSGFEKSVTEETHKITSHIAQGCILGCVLGGAEPDGARPFDLGAGAAAGADTLGGLPASAFVLAAPVRMSSGKGPKVR
jgi:hypothetical protein